MNIKLFKLISSEEIIAKVVGSDTSSWTLEAPMIIQLSQVAPGQVGVMLMPWIVGNQKTNVTLKTSTMAISEPIPAAKELEDQYLQQTSGIQLTKGLIK